MRLPNGQGDFFEIDSFNRGGLAARMDRVVRDEVEMEALGAEVAAGLERAGGGVVALAGGLGAGKTRFVKGLARALGHKGEVTSPTFSLAHEYRGGRLPVFHFDLYRLRDESELISIGWDEFLDEKGVIAAEWADLFPDFLPPGTLWLRFEVLPEGGRRVTMTRAEEETA